MSICKKRNFDYWAATCPEATIEQAFMAGMRLAELDRLIVDGNRTEAAELAEISQCQKQEAASTFNTVELQRERVLLHIERQALLGNPPDDDPLR